MLLHNKHRVCLVDCARFDHVFLPSRAGIAAASSCFPEDSETWQSSVLLLFETLPWVQPTKEFFPVPRREKGNSQFLLVLPSCVELQ